MTKPETPYNRLYYIRDNGMVGAGKNYCYEHDLPNCKTCPTCKDNLLCEACEFERSKHTNEELQKCVKYLGILYRNNESIIQGINRFIMHSHVYDKLILSSKIRNPNEPKDIVLAKRINIPNRIDT